MDEKDLSRRVKELLTPTPRHRLKSRDHESKSQKYSQHHVGWSGVE